MGPRQREESETEALVAVSFEISSQNTDEILLIAFQRSREGKQAPPHVDRTCSPRISFTEKGQVYKSQISNGA